MLGKIKYIPLYRMSVFCFIHIVQTSWNFNHTIWPFYMTTNYYCFLLLQMPTYFWMKDRPILKDIICPRPLGQRGRWRCAKTVNGSVRKNIWAERGVVLGWGEWVHRKNIKQLTELNQTACLWHVSCSLYSCFSIPILSFYF